jgi:hypothetical protein
MGSIVDSPIREYRKVKSLPPHSPSLSRTTTASSSTQDAYSVRSGSTSRVTGASASIAAGKAVGHGFGKVGLAITKTAVDLPLAVADGLHNMPSLYGDEVRDFGCVRGWKSGGIVGMKVCCLFLSCKSLLPRLLLDHSEKGKGTAIIANMYREKNRVSGMASGMGTQSFFRRL